MKHRKKRYLIIKPRHFRIFAGLAAAAVVIAAVLLILSSTGHEAKKQSAVSQAAQAGLIKIGLRGDLNKLCTYNDDTGEFEGFEKDVADEIVRRLLGADMLIQYVNVNTETRTAFLKKGEIDFALGAATYLKQSGIVYSTPYFSDGSAFLVMEDKISSMQQLSGGTIGIVQGTMHAQKSEKKKSAETDTKMSDYLKELDIEANVKVYASYPEAVEALRKGFVSAVCSSETALTQYGKPGMLMLPERFMPNDYCVMIKESLGLFSEAVDDTIAAMQKDGTLETLMSKWNLVNYTALETQ